jgi:hypothetical protein
MVLCRLSGLNLEKTGVIAGMSGSPVYIDGKLLGAVAYAWQFGKEPIAGVTPFCQMHGYVESFERRDAVRQARARRFGLSRPVTAGGRRYDAVTVCPGFDDPEPAAADGMYLVPLRTPLAASGFTAHSLKLLGERCRSAGLVPVQGGAAGGKIADQEKNTPLQAGGPLSVALVLGDFDLSGIGTVTHIEGSRVYGWGHPFFGVGNCEFPLMTGYIHTIYPRQSLSFKMGSPLRAVGVINADVSTCIAGWLHRKADLMPVRATVVREDGINTKTFNVQMVRQPSLMSGLVYSILTNCVDTEGELPEELTAQMRARIEVEGREPVVIDDTFSGPSYSGGKAPPALYNQVAMVVSLLAYNSYQPVRISRIDCETRIRPGRRSAEIESAELDSDTYEPGDTLRATVFVRPHRGTRRAVPVSIKLPADLPEGRYTATVCDDLHNARQELRANPTLSNPQNLDQVFQALKVQTSARRTNLVVRVPTTAGGVALHAQALPDLPSSMVHILANGRRTGAQLMTSALVSRQATPWVLQGSESLRFTVTKNKRVRDRD